MKRFLRICGVILFMFFSILKAQAEGRAARMDPEAADSKPVPLPDLVNPTGIHIASGRIFITEESSVAIYSIDDFRLLNTFGRRGEGPGEFKYPPYLIPQTGRLLILNLDRIFFFSLDGELVEERKFPLNYNYWAFPFLPVNGNYVGFPLEPVEGMGFGHIGRLYDQDFLPIKKVYDFVPSLFPPPPPPPRPGETSLSSVKQDLEAIPDCIDISAINDKFLVADTRKGFFFSVFDAQGNTLYEINKDFNKKRVSKGYRDAHMKALRENPDWESLNSRYNYVFKETFPAFFCFKTTGQKIYCITYEEQDSGHEIVELDLKGKIIQRSFSFPLKPYQRMNDTFILFSNAFDIHSGKVYHLEYNYEQETIELFITSIK